MLEASSSGKRMTKEGTHDIPFLDLWSPSNYAFDCCAQIGFLGGCFTTLPRLKVCLLLIHPERQKDIACSAGEAVIAGVDEQHPSHYDCAGGVHRSPVCRHAIHGLKGPVGIEAPHDGAILRGIGTQAAVATGREDHARNHR